MHGPATQELRTETEKSVAIAPSPSRRKPPFPAVVLATQDIPPATRAIELHFITGRSVLGAVVARLDAPMFDLYKKVSAEMLRECEIADHGSADQADHLS
jgi:hypothetical protein